MTLIFQYLREAVHFGRFRPFGSLSEPFRPQFPDICLPSSGPPCQEGEAFHVVNQVGYSNTLLNPCHANDADDPFLSSEHPPVKKFDARPDPTFSLVDLLLAAVRFPSAATLGGDIGFYLDHLRLASYRLPVKKNREFPAEFKAKAALEAIKEQETINQIASRYDVLPAQVSQWKGYLVKSLPQTFKGGRRGKDPKLECGQEKEECYQKIGQLEMQREWLKKI